MTRRILSLVLACILLLGCVPALADEPVYPGNYSFPTTNGITTNTTNYTAGSTLLSSLTHNCPNTGIMLPEIFSPLQTTYLLTVANWVSRPTFTPVAVDPNAIITVNGKVVQSGAKSQVIEMTDEPQAVTIQVTNNGASTTYTIYLQRRPSDKRTRISAGYLTNLYTKKDEWRVDADLVTLKYLGEDYASGNQSSFKNSGMDHYDYPVDPHCILYYGNATNPVRAKNMDEFVANYKVNNAEAFYTIIYIESEIVAILPYGADF